MAKTDSIARILALASMGQGGSGGGGTGTTDYNALVNQPKINGVTLIGNVLSSALGIKTSELNNDKGFITISDLVAGDGIDITGNVISADFDPEELISAIIKTGSITFDGVKDTFNLPKVGVKYLVFVNGIYMTEGSDYTIDDSSTPNTITFDMVYDDYESCTLVWLEAGTAPGPGPEPSDIEFATKEDIDNMFTGVTD